MSKSPIPWLTRQRYDAMSLDERALHHAALEYALYGDSNLEVEGANRGKHIRKYGEVAGLRDGVPWCALFVAWCYKQAGKAWTDTEKRLLPSSCHWLHSIVKPIPKPVRGCVGGWCNRSKWKGHLFFVAEVQQRVTGTWIRTYEGNTNRAGSREGDRIAMKWRRVTNAMRFGKVKT